MNLKHRIKRVLREEESEYDMSPMITDLLNKIIVVNNEDVCKVEVTAPWNRETISGGHYNDYAVKVYFIGGPKTKNWPRTQAVRDKEEEIMGEVWDTVYDFMGLYVDLYGDRVRKCNDNIQESIDKNGDEKIKRYLLRRVPWHEILEGLNNGIEWAERRCERYVDKLNAIDLDRYSNMVMSVLMDHILLFLKDEVSQEIIHYGASENYLRKLFSDEISKSYNRITD
jgi:hypothetical protein